MAEGLGFVQLEVKQASVNDVASLRDRVAAASTRKAELLSGTSVAPSIRSRATAELHQARDTILTQSKSLEKIAQLKTTIKNPKV